MKKEDEILEDEIVDEVDESIEVDSDSEDEILEVEVEQEMISSDSPKPKKKLPKGAKIGIITGSVIVGIVAIVLIVMAVMPYFMKEQVVGDANLVLKVNGYQQPVNISKIELQDDPSRDAIVPVSTMLEAEGLSVSKSSDAVAIASRIYALAVTNYANVKGTGWYCYTDSSVYADDVKAKLGVQINVPKFEVNVRAAYCLGSYGDYNFSQTVSGVTKLDLDVGAMLKNAVSSLKGMFGYNIQQCRYDTDAGEWFAFRRGPNGGAQFHGDNEEIAYKYLMGAYNPNFPTDLNRKYANDGSYDSGTFYVDEYDPDAPTTAQKLDYIDVEDPDEHERVNAWDPLNLYYDYAYKLTFPKESYYVGCFGDRKENPCGWGIYNFAEEFLDSQTTVTYDASKDVYTLNIVVKKDKANEACKLALGSLVKDTKDYIQMKDAVYTLEENIIEVFGNGLIKSWNRIETIKSEKPAKLVILSGDCYKGGGTKNVTRMSFSYDPIDYMPEALAARYWPELGNSNKVKDGKAMNFGTYPSFDKYEPKKNK